jgi:hypothetical protein
MFKFTASYHLSHDGHTCFFPCSPRCTFSLFPTKSNWTSFRWNLQNLQKKSTHYSLSSQFTLVCVTGSSLGCNVVINVELGREGHSSIPRNCDREGAETTWCQNWPPNQIKLMMKVKKKITLLHFTLVITSL